MSAKIRAEVIGDKWWHVAYVNGKRYMLRAIGRVGDCLRFGLMGIALITPAFANPAGYSETPHEWTLHYTPQWAQEMRCGLVPVDPSNPAKGFKKVCW